MPLQRPTILLFVPFYNRASIAAEKCWDDETGAVGVHTATVEVRDSSDSLAVSDSFGAGGDYMLASLSLTPGERYKARMRYHTDSEDSPWSYWYFARVPLDEPDYAALAVTGAPSDGGTLPVTPDFQQPIRHARPLHEFVTESNHPIRRAKFTDEYREARIVWLNKTTAERDALMTFLTARIAAAEAFRSDDPILGDRLWWPRAGSIQEIHIDPSSPGVWTLSIDAEQVP